MLQDCATSPSLGDAKIWTWDHNTCSLALNPLSYHISYQLSYHISYPLSYHISYPLSYHISYRLSYHISYQEIINAMSVPSLLQKKTYIYSSRYRTNVKKTHLGKQMTIFGSLAEPIIVVIQWQIAIDLFMLLICWTCFLLVCPKTRRVVMSAIFFCKKETLDTFNPRY